MQFDGLRIHFTTSMTLDACRCSFEGIQAAVRYSAGARATRTTVLDVHPRRRGQRVRKPEIQASTKLEFHCPGQSNPDAGRAVTWRAHSFQAHARMEAIQVGKLGVGIRLRTSRAVGSPRASLRNCRIRDGCR